MSDSAPKESQATTKTRTNRIKTLDSTEVQDSYRIKKLPRQLKRKFYEAMEPRFFIILLSSLFLHAVTVLYFSKHFPRGDKEVITEKVRERFANLLLEGKEDLDAEMIQAVEAEKETAINYQLLESVLDEPNTAGPAIDELLDLNRPEARETDLPTVEKRKAERSLNAQKRRSAIKTLSRDVERTGLLGVLTSATGNVPVAEVADILNFADSTGTDLEQSLAFLTSLRVPRRLDPVAYAFYSNSAFSGAVNPTDLIPSPPKVRGKRILRNVKVEDIVEKLGEVKAVSVKKVERFESVPSSFAPNRLRTVAGDGYANGHVLPSRRDPDRLREVVLSHYSAIQDCYNQGLKSDRNLKGKVVVRFVIAPEGDVISAAIVSSTIYDQDMLDCILSRILRWNDFPPLHPSAGNMAIKQSYVFGF